MTDAEDIAAAEQRLDGPAADQFARDLDLLGWKIVPQRIPEKFGKKFERWWLMNGSQDPCPSWAYDPFAQPETLHWMTDGKPPCG